MGDEALVAHYIRRLTFGPRPGQLDQLLSLGAPAALDALLAAEPTPIEEAQLGTDDDYAAMRRWYLDTLRHERADLHERMVWFWHGHLTSSLSKSEPLLMYRQQLLFREHALGNLRTLLKQVSVDGAMLSWLDGADSKFEAPNENYARELMELFTLGRGNYSEGDVRAAAKAMSGYWLDDDNGLSVEFDESSGPQEAVTFLGREGVQSVDDVIDTLCDHPACPRWIASRLFAFFVGRPSSDDESQRFADVLRDNDLEIRPLVEAILRDAAFASAPALTDLRPKSPLEWVLTAERFLDTQLEEWQLDVLGQVPLVPPNVAGWPGGSRLISTSAQLARAQFAYDSSWDTTVEDTDDLIGALLWRAGIVTISDETRAALDDAIGPLESRRDRATVAHSLILNSPEFCLT